MTPAEDLENVRPMARPPVKGAAPANGNAPVSLAPIHRWMTPAERALTIGGAVARLPTGFATFDAACRGGPMTKRFGVVGGAPGAGKTAFEVRIAFDYAKRGIPTAIAAYDEDAHDLLIRIGQLVGLRREDLENGDETARKALSDFLAPLPLMLVDGDEENATVEDISAELAHRAHGQPSAMFVDSIQTARVNGIEMAKDKKARADIVVAALKAITKRDRHFLLATSELARGAYRSRKFSEQIDDLAAFKESGDIEYGVGIAVVLRSAPSDPGLIQVSMPKNRMGRRLPFYMRMDFDRADLAEVDAPADDMADSGKRTAQYDKIKKEILRKVRDDTRMRSKNAVWRAVGGSKEYVLEALGELLDDKAVTMVDGSFRAV